MAVNASWKLLTFWTIFTIGFILFRLRSYDLMMYNTLLPVELIPDGLKHEAFADVYFTNILDLIPKTLNGRTETD